jgi:hypothetical protein
MFKLFSKPTPAPVDSPEKTMAAMIENNFATIHFTPDGVILAPTRYFAAPWDTRSTRS